MRVPATDVNLVMLLQLMTLQTGSVGAGLALRASHNLESTMSDQSSADTIWPKFGNVSLPDRQLALMCTLNCRNFMWSRFPGIYLNWD